jgi:hypothetical protein
MRITYEDATRPPGYLSAALKVVIVHPQVCVAYAGTVCAALDAIRALEFSEDGPDIAGVREHLLERHKKTNADFLIATLNPTGLIALRDGTASEPSIAWIGDGEAIIEFLKAFYGDPALDPMLSDKLSAEQRPAFEQAVAEGAKEMAQRWAEDLSKDEWEDLDVAQRSMNAMNVVVHSQVKDVGEHAIFVVPRLGVFAYLVSSFASTGRPRPENQHLSGVKPFRAGSAEHGDFAFAVLKPTDGGIGAIGIYFLEGELGLLHHPMKFDKPQRYSNVSVSQFKQAVHNEHGFRLGGIGIRA